MSTSLNSPPIGSEDIMDKQTLAEYKSTPKIEKAVAKIKATKKDMPKVVFLDNQAEAKTKNMSEQDKEIAQIETEQERIRIEQANKISIVPANTDTNKQLDRSNKGTTQEQIITQQNTLQQQDILQQQIDIQQDLLQQHDTTQQQDNFELQDSSPLVIITATQSLRSITTSQEYKTPPVSPDIDDISDLNSEDIRELDETL